MFKVIRSSAGAGKTHALVKQYLEHCLREDNPAAYRQVLALTFTTKAAEEMRERAVGYLRKLSAGALSDGAITDVMEALKQTAKTDEEAIARRADAALRHMLHHYGDVAISTIDAFTRRVARPFARDLRLDQALRMTTDQDWYRDRAVDAVIAEAGTHPEVTQLLVQACEQLLEEERKWDPAERLRALITELDQERSIEPLEALRALDARSATALSAKLSDGIHAERDRIRAAGEAGLRLVQGIGVPEEAWAQGSRGLWSWLRKLARFGDELVALNGHVEKMHASGKWHGSKASADEKARIDAAADRIAGAYAEAARVLEAGQRRYFLLRAIRRELPTAFALHELSRHLEQLKQDDGVAFFSDLTRRVAEMVRDEPAPWIMERVGERFRHFLIDEFQDTSLLQWQCLLPLIDNALASGGSAFIVGDAKQAIYRWRNGEAQLLTSFPKLHGRASSTDAQREAALVKHFTETKPLAANRRSARTIVEFNNSLFDALPQVLAPHLRKAYEGQRQEAFRSEEGLVRIEVLPEDATGEAARSATSAFLLRCVDEALEDGFRRGDIAVLVRGRTDGHRAAEALKAHGHPVSSPDGAKLASSDSAQLIADLMRVAHARQETAAARALQRMARLQAPPDAAFAAPLLEPRHGAALEQVEHWLRDHGWPALRTTLTALIEALAAALGLDPARDGQLLAFLDEAHAFGLEHGQDIAGFLEHWDRKGGERSAQAMEAPDAIRIMTIHKAKGLEFPVVVMPSVRMAPQRESGKLHWIGLQEELDGLHHALVEARKPLIDLKIPEIDGEAEHAVLDSLNLLYVAFTRPVQRLYALATRHRADAVTKALIEHLGVDAARAWTIGARRAPWTDEPHAAPGMLPPTPSNRMSGLPLHFEAPERWDPEDPDPLRQRGILVHALLSRLHDASGLPDALRALRRDGTIDDADAARLEAELAPLLRSPALARWFAPGLHARTEATIITADGHALRPDRVVIDGRAARVLDIKTGGRSDSHHDQVRGYLRALRELGYDPVEGALLYIREGAVEPVLIHA